MRTKELLKEYTKSTSAKRRYHYIFRQPTFRQGPHPISSGGWHQSHQNQGFMPRDGQRKFYFMKGDGKLESQSPFNTYIQCKSETKNTKPFKFDRIPKSSTICNKTFQEDQRNVGEGCHKGGKLLQGTVCHPSMSSIKE